LRWARLEGVAVRGDAYQAEPHAPFPPLPNRDALEIQ
jgi:hypothetical protein